MKDSEDSGGKHIQTRVPSLSANRFAAPRKVGENELPGAPEFLKIEVKKIEDRAQLVYREARKDSFAYWFLKAPAALLSACAGLPAVDLVPTNVGALLGLVAALAVALDGLMPRQRVRLFQIHLNAFHDFRNIQEKIRRTWSIESPTTSDEGKVALAQGIMRSIEEEIDRINRYIRDGESLFLAGPMRTSHST